MRSTDRETEQLVSRGERYARARAWRPYRKESSSKSEPLGPRGEIWIVDEALAEVERVDEKVVDRDVPTR